MQDVSWNRLKVKQLFLQLAREIRANGASRPTAKRVQRDGVFKVRGKLVLFEEDAKKYNTVFDKLIKIIPQDVRSRDFIDTIFSETLYSAINASSEADIKQEAEGLLLALGKPPISFNIRIAVHGLDLACTGLDFGKISFLCEESQIPPNISPNMPEELKGEVLFAVTDVNAVDEDSAMEIARVRIDRHLAILNAICSNAAPSSFRVSRSFADQFDYSIFRIKSENGGGTSGFGSTRQRVPFYRHQLLKLLEDHGGNLMSELLRKESPIALRITSAFETAGFACIENQPHVSFLLFAIALESAVLGGKKEEQLTFQLALRTAHLISASRRGRLEIFERVKRLYGLRSRVAHSGSKQIEQHDVAEMKLICLEALYSLLSYDAVCRFEKETELEQWFLDQLLDSALLKSTE